MKTTRIILVTALLGMVFATSSCNTASGVGRDLQILGEKMERSATKYNDKPAVRRSNY